LHGSQLQPKDIPSSRFDTQNVSNNFEKHVFFIAAVMAFLAPE
jgi:hypothetical protein